MPKLLADKYICNFSLFQTVPDHWAIGALFPIAPLERLNEKPTRDATLVDISCDSDGKINKFIDLRDVKATLPLHELREGEPYYLGIFLTGAYQDVLANAHNLFGPRQRGTRLFDRHGLHSRALRQRPKRPAASSRTWATKPPNSTAGWVRKSPKPSKKATSATPKPPSSRAVYDAELVGYTYLEEM